MNKIKKTKKVMDDKKKKYIYIGIIIILVMLILLVWLYWFLSNKEIKVKAQVINNSNELICFSKMTFPHQLIRLFLLEQIFRGFKINNNETYHH